VRGLLRALAWAWNLNSESGGAPISCDGGNSLDVIEPDVLADRQWGDERIKLETSESS